MVLESSFNNGRLPLCYTVDPNQPSGGVLRWSIGINTSLLGATDRRGDAKANGREEITKLIE